MNKPDFIMLVGLPGSSKSTWAENHKEELNMIIHSSDAIREEFGDVNDQSKNDLVFKTLHSRIKEDLLNGKNVCYDATNLNRRKRMHFLCNELRNVPCKKVCVLFATPYEVCLKNNANRERKVPEDVIDRMYLNYESPWYTDGFNEIKIVYWDYEKEGLKFEFHEKVEEWRKVSQDNPHHTLSVGDHMIKAYEYICDKTDNFLLQVAAYMHDCGKIHTKKFIDSKGKPCLHAHFYQHHCCGSYDSLFYLKDMFDEELEFKNDEILYVSLLINLHMRHHMAYKQSDKAKEKDRRLFADKIIKDLEMLYEADIYAH
jgi:predicted kinase